MSFFEKFNFVIFWIRFYKFNKFNLYSSNFQLKVLNAFFNRIIGISKNFPKISRLSFNQNFKVWKNYLKRVFHASACNQKWGRTSTVEGLLQLIALTRQLKKKTKFPYIYLSKRFSEFSLKGENFYTERFYYILLKLL